MINTKDNIYVEGFDHEYEYRSYLYGSKGISNSIELIYQGRVDDIPEETLTECIESETLFDDLQCIGVWFDGIFGYYPTAKEAIKATLRKPGKKIFEYCIIFKK
jgi:hypothetical protein